MRYTGMIVSLCFFLIRESFHLFLSDGSVTFREVPLLDKYLGKKFLERTSGAPRLRFFLAAVGGGN